MPHILILNEGQQAGMPVWRFAWSRGEAVFLHAPWRPRDDGQKTLVNRLRHGTLDQDAFNRAVRDNLACDPDDVLMRTICKPWAAVDLGWHEDEAYAVYLPCSEKDFARLCNGEAYGFEAVAPCELSKEARRTFSTIHSKIRPLRYLREADLCAELRVPWVYLLGLYYESSLALFIAESEGIIAAVEELSKGVKECWVISPKDVAAREKHDWLFYGAEERLRITEEQKKNAREAIERFSDQLPESEP